jgi:hypothetical protein
MFERVQPRTEFLKLLVDRLLEFNKRTRRGPRHDSREVSNRFAMFAKERRPQFLNFPAMRRQYCIEIHHVLLGSL